MAYNPSGMRGVSNWLDDKCKLHQDGWFRSSIHAGWHAAAGVTASVNAYVKSDGLLNPGDQSQAKREFARAKEQWDRVDNNKFGRTKDSK